MTSPSSSSRRSPLARREECPVCLGRIWVDVAAEVAICVGFLRRVGCGYAERTYAASCHAEVNRWAGTPGEARA